MHTDRNAITDTITDLFVATDNRDWAAVRRCFAPQVRFDMTSLGGGEPSTMTPADIASGWEAGLSPVQHVFHQAGNFKVTIRGDEADAFCYAIAFHRGDNIARTFAGSYDFHLVRAGDHWVIDLFRYNVKFVDGA